MATSDVPDAPQEYGLPPLDEDREYDDAWLTSAARRINWCANVRALIRRGDGPGHTWRRQGDGIVRGRKHCVPKRERSRTQWKRSRTRRYRPPHRERARAARMSMSVNAPLHLN